MAIKIIMLIVFFAITIGIGVYCKKQATDVRGFVLGGRSVGPWLTAFAYGTSYFSAVIFIGYAGQFGWKYGVAATWIGLGNAFIGSLMAWAVLGRRTRIMTQHLDAATMPDFFGKRFDSQALKTASAAIIFIFLIPYTASVYNGLSRLFGMAFNIDYSYCVIAMSVLTAIYVILGGYMATAVNDFIQGCIMLVGIAVIIAAVLNINGGFLGSLEAMANVTGSTPAEQIPGIFNSFFGPDPVNLLGVVILTSLGTWGLPQMVGKFYAIKSEKDINIGTIVSTVFALVVAGGCYFLGGFGRLFGDIIEYNPATGLPVYDSIVPSMLSVLPDLLIAITVMLVLSASMSTLSSLVLTSSSVLTLDLVNATVSMDMDEKKKVSTMRIFIVVFIVLSAVIALIQYKSSVTFIAQLMGISWGALAGAFLGPFLYSLYWKKVTKAAVWASFATGVGLTTGNMILGFFGKEIIASPINCGAVAMILSLIIVPAVSMITAKPSETRMEEVFSCYEEKVLVSKRNALED
ncbi:MAG: sodium:solute symporter [Firmicutes bacterium]|nr:sodium:solute symporter [Bacillota bacterium]